MFARRAFALLSLASFFALASFKPASADLMLGLSLSEPGFSPYTVIAPLDPLIINSSFGTFSTNVEVNNVSTNPLSVDLGSLNLGSFAAGNLTITASVTGLTTPTAIPGFLSQLSGNFFGAVDSVSLNTYLSNSNTMFGTDTLLSSLMATGGPFAMAQNVSATPSETFGVTEVLNIKTSGAAVLSVDASTTAAPEIDARAGGAAIALILGLCALLAERRRLVPAA